MKAQSVIQPLVSTPKSIFKTSFSLNLTLELYSGWKWAAHSFNAKLAGNPIPLFIVLLLCDNSIVFDSIICAR